MTIFPQTPHSDSYYFIETTAYDHFFHKCHAQIHTILLRQLHLRNGRLLSHYSCLMFRSQFPTNNNNNSIVSNQLTKLCIGKTQYKAFFFLFEDSKQYVVSINVNNNTEH